jgi:hypothetical protein
MSSVTPDEGEFIALLPRAGRQFLALGYQQTLTPDGLGSTGGGGDRLWEDQGDGRLRALGGINISISGFPAPLVGLVFNPRPVLLPDGEYLAPMYGHLKAAPTGCNASSSGECDSVFFVRSTDQGQGERWRYASQIDRSPTWMPWVDSEGPCEPSLALLPDGRLLTLFRVDARSMVFQAFSADRGRSWVNISRTPAWAVMPQLQLLSSGVLAMSSGRPGLRMWARPTAGGANDDDRWTAFDLAAEHTARVAEPARWGYTGHTLNASCSGGPAASCGRGLTTCTMCTPAATPPQTTAYTGLAELPATDEQHQRGESRMLVVYDRLANGWSFPPGPWGDSDAIFSMVVTLSLV